MYGLYEFFPKKCMDCSDFFVRIVWIFFFKKCTGCTDLFWKCTEFLFGFFQKGFGHPENDILRKISLHNSYTARIPELKVIMQGKLFQICNHLLYCSVLSLGGNVNTRRMSQPDMRSIFHITNQWNTLVIWTYYVSYQNFQNQCSYPPRIQEEH